VSKRIALIHVVADGTYGRRSLLGVQALHFGSLRTDRRWEVSARGDVANAPRAACR
jgi:hypothetical protein